MNEDQFPIYVTKTFLPPQDEFLKLLDIVWEGHQLTNGGPLLYRLIECLKTILKVPYILPTANGTLSLHLAIKALELSGEIITTPLSYVATSSAIVWENCTPVFADIESEHWCIDPEKVERAITPKTTAILATHVFGNPCDVERLDEIAKDHGLKIIYDAAHCFGVEHKSTSIFNYGDLSVCSFHATKIFHTGEGGCIITGGEAMFEKLVWLHNLGHKGQDEFQGLGLNGKMSELQAAMGLAILPYVASLIEQRKSYAQIYDGLLDDTGLKRIKIRENTKWNYAYYPVLFESEERLLKVMASLNQEQIFPRRYFYPSLNTLEFLNKKTMPVAEDVASRILCLPMSNELRMTDIERIAIIILDSIDTYPPKS